MQIIVILTIHLCNYFIQISGEFRQLKPVFREVISDITQKMGSGMCVFLEDRVGSMTQWDEVWLICCCFIYTCVHT